MCGTTFLFNTSLTGRDACNILRRIGVIQYGLGFTWDGSLTVVIDWAGALASFTPFTQLLDTVSTSGRGQRSWPWQGSFRHGSSFIRSCASGIVVFFILFFTLLWPISGFCARLFVLSLWLAGGMTDDGMNSFCREVAPRKVSEIFTREDTAASFCIDARGFFWNRKNFSCLLDHIHSPLIEFSRVLVHDSRHARERRPPASL